MVPTSRLPVSSPEPLSLPPLSSLLPGARSAAMLAESQLLNPSNTPIDFPAFLPDPRMRLPFSKKGSLTPVPTFTPLMCDPIVHIPVIDVCSSGQGYFVSAGSGIATSIPPFPESDIMVDKGARETLRLLISSSSTSTSPLMNVLPAVLNNDRDKGSFLLAGSRGLYSGTSNVEAIAKGIAAVGVVPLSGRSSRVGANTEDYGISSGRGGSLDACEGVSDEEAEDQ
ncbi:hypothetical protein Nepgr_020921 [Nepenthes gracilis]|uniref:Uncharacterized protein n=1 Tax=Nepenthes gracilis TaxID=150966 RepID=A0AAD3XWQ5_NEPGR|nr:hypothetical protein Nepgr_020921 [Nepenthes gracilis]